MDARTARFNRLVLERHPAARMRVEDRTAQRLYRLLEQTRRELAGRILAFEEKWQGERTYTSHHLASVLGDISTTMAALREAATSEVRAVMLEGYTLSQEQTYGELTAMLGDFMGRWQPAAPLDPMLNIIEARTDVLGSLFNGLEARLASEIRLSAAQASGQVRGIQDALARGLASGDGMRELTRRLTHPKTGEFRRLSYRDALTITRLAVNDAYNAGHVTTLSEAKETDPELRQVWVSARVGSTPICLGLHGQRAEVGERFTWHDPEGGTWEGLRPPAIGEGARPRFHLCRSRVAPDHPDWPPNPKLEPLDDTAIAHYEGGGGWRESDIAKRKKYPGLAAPRAPRVL